MNSLVEALKRPNEVAPEVPWSILMAKAAAEIERLQAKVALLEHEAECHWCAICSPGDWTRQQCPECARLQKAVDDLAVAEVDGESDAVRP